jgi:serine/threonine protein kinase
VLFRSRYTTKVDTWAAGCILGELIGRRPVFSGDDTSDMLVKICGRIGFPAAEDVRLLTEQEAARRFVLSIQHKTCRSLADLLPTADHAGLALMRSLLEWTPGKRASVEEALKSEYLKELYEPPQPLETNHAELAAISCGNLHPWLVLDLICLEGCAWRSTDAHYKVPQCSDISAMPRSAKIAHQSKSTDIAGCAHGGQQHTDAPALRHAALCACGQTFASGLQFLTHLESGLTTQCGS